MATDGRPRGREPAGQATATIPGWGPVSAQVTRELIARAIDETQAWVRRLYADPAGNLVAQSTKQRLKSQGLSAYLTVRDHGLCRTPYCDAPTRHSDHVERAADRGPTDRRSSHHHRSRAPAPPRPAGLQQPARPAPRSDVEWRFAQRVYAA